MGIVMPPSMKAIMEIMTSPTSWSKDNPSVEQYRIDTSWGMWYFSLNSSIKVGFFTRRSNLPILSLWNRKWRADEVIRGDKRSCEIKTYVDWNATDLRSSWESLRSSWKYDERSEGEWVWRLECSEDYELQWRKEEMIFRSLYIRNWKPWGDFIPPKS